MKKDVEQELLSHIQMIGMSIFVSAGSMAFITGFFRQIGYSEMFIGSYGSVIGIAGLYNIMGPCLVNRLGNYKKTAIIIFFVSILSFAIGVILAYYSQKASNSVISYFVLLFMMLWHLGLYMNSPIYISWLHSIVGHCKWHSFFSTRIIISDITVMFTTLMIGQYLGDSPKVTEFLVVFSFGGLFALISSGIMFRFLNVTVKQKKTRVKEFISSIIIILKQRNLKQVLVAIFIRAIAYGMIIPFQALFFWKK